MQLTICLLISLAPAHAAGKHQKSKADGAYAEVEKGESFLQHGDMASAAAHFQRALAMGTLPAKDGAGIAFNLGLMNMRAEHGPEALHFFGEALKLDNTLRDAHLKSAFLHKRRGDASRAAHHLHEAIALAPQKPDAYTYLAEVMNNRKRFSEAAELYKSALGINPAMVEAHIGLGDAMANAKRPTEAMAAYGNALYYAPLHGEALAGKWSAQMHSSSWGGIERVFGRLLKSVRTALRKKRPSPISPYQSLYLPLAPRSKTRIAASWARQFATVAQSSVRGGGGGGSGGGGSAAAKTKAKVKANSISAAEVEAEERATTTKKRQLRLGYIRCVLSFL